MVQVLFYAAPRASLQTEKETNSVLQAAVNPAAPSPAAADAPGESPASHGGSPSVASSLSSISPPVSAAGNPSLSAQAPAPPGTAMNALDTIFQRLLMSTLGPLSPTRERPTSPLSPTNRQPQVLLLHSPCLLRADPPCTSLRIFGPGGGGGAPDTRSLRCPSLTAAKVLKGAGRGPRAQRPGV